MTRYDMVMRGGFKSMEEFDEAQRREEERVQRRLSEENKRAFEQTTPNVEVQPVKRGRWIETHISLCKWIPENEKEEGHNFYMAEMKCSCCERYNTQTFSLTLKKPDFCQHCGATIIKDGDEE